MLSSTVANIFPSFSPQNASRTSSSTTSTRLPIICIVFIALALFLGNNAEVSDTVQSVSSSASLASLQKALLDGHEALANYAGYGTATNAASTSNKKRYIVLPATAANPGFCRTLFALLINDYGPPTIVSSDATAVRLASHLPMVNLLASYLFLTRRSAACYRNPSLTFITPLCCWVKMLLHNYNRSIGEVPPAQITMLKSPQGMTGYMMVEKMMMLS